jgi:hypothetical protein
MSNVLREMYNNLNYYYQVTGPLHTSKNYTEQVELVMSVMSNLSNLASDMDNAAGELSKIENDLNSHANNHFKDYDKNINMKDSERDSLFEDAMADFKQSLKLVRNKFTVIDNKVEELGKITDDFHYSTDKLEALFMRDIEKRRKYF